MNSSKIDPKTVSKIESKFEKAQDALVIQQSDLSLKSLSDMVEFEAVDISPKYQRRERWNELKESSLIESFLLNIPVPPIYLAEDRYGVYSVIDGKQRITAINKFLTNKMKLADLDKFPELDGLYFKDLPSSLSNALSIRPYLRVVTLLRQSDPDLKHEVFLRLNKAGVSLNSQEIRNVAFRGDLNDALFELSDNPFLKEMLKSGKNTKIYQEMGDVQYVLRFFTVLSLWDNFPGNMDKAMDIYMAENARASDKKVEELKSLFLRSINFCEAVWGKDSYKRIDNSQRVIQGVFDVQMVCSAFLSDQEYNSAIIKAQEVRDALNSELINNAQFLEAVTQFTSNPKNIKYRISHFCEILKGI